VEQKPVHHRLTGEREMCSGGGDQRSALEKKKLSDTSSSFSRKKIRLGAEFKWGKVEKGEVQGEGRHKLLKRTE